MGVNRLYFLTVLAFALAVVMGLTATRPSLIHSVDLADVTCFTGAESVEAAFSAPPEALDCTGRRNAGRFERFVRARSDLARLDLIPPGPLVLQTNPTSFDSMLIRLDYADGTQRLIDVDAQMAVRNWDAGGSFWVPIPRGASPLAVIDRVVERPRSPTLFARMTLSNATEAQARHYGRTLLYVLICGVLLVPIIYDLLFYRVLRARFMIWHVGMTLGTLLYVLFNSGIVLLLVPDMPGRWRFAGTFLAMSLTILGTARFSLLILEEGSLAPRWRLTIMAPALVNLALAALLLLDFEALRMWIVDAYLVSLVPVVLSAGAVVALAVSRGSRAALFLAAAYSGLILAGGAQVIASLWRSDLTVLLDDAVYAALVLLVIGTSVAVGDRLMVIKAEGDRARLTARRLGTMATSDGLTGLLNRRAFDRHRRLAPGRALLLADIDRFKAVNDTFGHQRGDQVLCQAARTLAAVIAARGKGEVYRLGGEEFAVLVAAAKAADMAALAETLRAAIEAAGGAPDEPDLPGITISIGAVLGAGQLMSAAIADADAALYRAKKGGRNRWELAPGDAEYAI